MALLTLQGVGQSFSSAKGERVVLDQVNLTVNEGEFVCIVGCSGSGKTTLMSLVAGLAKPDQGTLLFEGKPVEGPGPERGLIFQNYSLLPWMTVFENVHLAVEAVSAGKSPAHITERTEHLISLVNLKAAMKKRPRELSGGMRQRVALARGLGMNPKLLLMDEPLSALDALTRSTLQEEITRIWMSERNTVMMVTNDIDEAILMADRICLLTPGPAATLKMDIAVPFVRPRSKHALNLNPQYQQIRKRIIEFFTEQRNPAGQGIPTSLNASDVTPAEAGVQSRFSPA